MQLKALIKKKAEENHISAQLIMQNYMMERLLERLSISRYRQNFILKGGFLIAAIVGLDTRATMDLDTTVKGLTLAHESIRVIFEEICAIHVEDDIVFYVNRTSDIREGDVYPGMRVHLSANYPPLAVPLTIDVTTGDKITPKEVEYSFKLMFDDRSISILAYNLETILAEKLETVLSRSIANTRPRDFYDIHILYTLRGHECDVIVLRQALDETCRKRGSQSVLIQYRDTIEAIRSDAQMRGFWDKYRKEYTYADDISFDDTCATVLLIMENLFPQIKAERSFL
jgi:predicted nucleotidyltransferase component of viral defense system